MILNSEQQVASNTSNGVVIITAIPGAGKTATVTQRVINLVKNHDIKPSNILCLTFTNKAAKEMKDRISSALKTHPDVNDIWISTFHRLALFAIRQYGDIIGLQKNFSIYDADDQEDCLAKMARMNGADCDKSDIRSLVAKSNDFRENMLTWEQFGKENDFITTTIVKEYFKWLLEKNAVDFSGMMYHFWQLLQHKEVQSEFLARFTYVHVDESQDVNGIQFEIIKLLAAHNNLFAVGDFCQNIFSFRSSSYKYFAEVEQHFPAVQRITLPKNYRSTPEILKVAQKLIRHNRNASDVLLVPMKQSGMPVTVKEFVSPEHEACFVADTVIGLHKKHNIAWSDFAVLYRMNSLSRSIEMAFRNRGIPTRVIGGFSFFDRTEIKNAIAYLSFLSNIADTTSFVKAIKFPKRSIGNETISKLEKQAELSQQNILLASKTVKLSGKAQTNMDQFVNAYCVAQEMMANKSPLYDVANTLFTLSGYTKAIQELSDQNEDDADRINNLIEFLSSIKEYQDSNPSNDLSDYLQSIRLMTDYEQNDKESNQVSLLTGHSAKGMEFKNVFLIACEENIMPHYFSKNSIDEIEEERRLTYVCVTRAIERLYVSMAKTRNFRQNDPSRFVAEMGFQKKHGHH